MPHSDSNITFPRNVRGEENLRNQILHGEARVELGGQSLSTTNIGAGPRLEEMRHETTNVRSLEDVSLNLGNNQVSNGPPFLRNTGSGHILPNLDLNAGYADNYGGENIEAGPMPLQYKSGENETEQIPTVGGSINPSSGAGNFTEEGDGRPGSSSDGRRSSCKRKAVEGASAQSSLDASSSCPQIAETVLQNSAPGLYNAGGSLSISAPAANPPGVHATVPLEPRLRVGTRGLNSDNHPALHLAGNIENNNRSFRMRISPAYQQDSAALSLSSTGTAIRHSPVWSPHQLPVGGFLPFTQSSNAGQTTGSPSGTQLQSDMINISGPSPITHPFPWNGASDSRVGSSSSSPVIPRTAPLQVVSSRSMPRNISEPTIFAPSAEIRNLGQDTTIWRLPYGNAIIAGVGASSSQAGPSSAASYQAGPSLFSASRAGPSSASQPSSAPTQLPHPNPQNGCMQMFPVMNHRPLVISSASASRADPSTASLPGPSLASASRAGPSSGSQPSYVPTWVAHPNPNPYMQMFPEINPHPIQLRPHPHPYSQSQHQPPQHSYQPQPESPQHYHQPLPQPPSQPYHHPRPHPPQPFAQPQPDLRQTLWAQQIIEGTFRGPLPFWTSAAVSEIRNVLNLMRRSAEGAIDEGALMVQEPMFFRVAGDPGEPDSPDRHSDMRLDVDNMSYEELLDLEERIGNVKTGLSEETILTYLKQKKYPSLKVGGLSEVEPCCICREEYVNGDDVGVLECAHAFHTDCIKQWLMEKNLCPICKTTALVT